MDNVFSDKKYVAPKMWKDLSADEKADRTREQVKSLQNTLNSLHQKINNIENDLKKHNHLEGRVVKALGEDMFFSSAGSMISKLANPQAEENGEVYF